MQYKDRIYGEFEITEPVILDLINCKTIQRLKEIDSAGYLEPFFPQTKRSRFEHSVGVYLLLKIYGTSIEERIAGLIHDISHSAFSHCIDYALDVGSQKEHNHQDNIFDNFVKKSDIPEILKKYNIDLDYVLDDKNFPLKEKQLPDLCADRIDYILRDSVIFKEVKSVKYFFDNLVVYNNQWVFNSFEIADEFAKLFLKINIKYYSSIISAVMFQTVSDYLRHALLNKYIIENDLYTTDEKVLKKIEPFLKKDEELKLLFDRMNNRIEYKNDRNDYDVNVFCKSRVVDPLCFYNNEIKRVSEIEPKWKETIERESQSKEYFLKFKF